MSDLDRSRIAHGGKGLYGSRVGILMLETKFPRIPGDMGNGTTWPFPVLYKVVPGATPDRVVRHKSAGLINAFLDAVYHGFKAHVAEGRHLSDAAVEAAAKGRVWTGEEAKQQGLHFREANGWVEVTE